MQIDHQLHLADVHVHSAGDFDSVEALEGQTGDFIGLVCGGGSARTSGIIGAAGPRAIKAGYPIVNLVEQTLKLNKAPPDLFIRIAAPAESHQGQQHRGNRHHDRRCNGRR